MASSPFTDPYSIAGENVSVGVILALILCGSMGWILAAVLTLAPESVPLWLQRWNDALDARVLLPLPAPTDTSAPPQRNVSPPSEPLDVRRTTSTSVQTVRSIAPEAAEDAIETHSHAVSDPLPSAGAERRVTEAFERRSNPPIGNDLADPEQRSQALENERLAADALSDRDTLLDVILPGAGASLDRSQEPGHRVILPVLEASSLRRQIASAPGDERSVPCAPLFSATFDTGGIRPRESDLGAKAKRLGEWLARHPGLVVSVEGYTDASGSEELNLLISHRRAKAIARRMIEAGVGKDRLVTRAMGETEPLGVDLEERRRVVLRIDGMPTCRDPDLENNR